jgi:hypothetical protein
MAAPSSSSTGSPPSPSQDVSRDHPPAMIACMHAWVDETAWASQHHRSGHQQAARALSIKHVHSTVLLHAIMKRSERFEHAVAKG